MNTALESDTAQVDPYGLGEEMVCEYEFEPGETQIFWPTERAHPGSPDNVTLLACKVGGVDIYPMLSNAQIERIENAILELRQ